MLGPKFMCHFLGDKLRSSFLRQIKFMALRDKIHGQSFGTNIKAHFCAKVQSSFMGQTISHYLLENIDVSFVGQKSKFIFFGTRRKLFREIHLHIREKLNNSNFKELCERFQKQSSIVKAKGNQNFTVIRSSIWEQKQANGVPKHSLNIDNERRDFWKMCW